MEAKTYIFQYAFQNHGGEIKKDKSEWTGYYQNCIEAMEIFTKDFEENGLGKIIHIHVKRKKEEKKNG